MQSVGVFVGGYGILPYPRHPLKSSHRIHRVHRSFWRRIFSHRIHRIHRSFWRRIFSHGIHRMLGCVIGSVGMAGMPYPPNLCLSVGGFLCQNVLCVPRVLWEHSLCLLCWCCRGSCTSVVVFSPRNSRNSRNVRLRYWRRGYGRMPYPPNLCASVPICGRLSLPEGSVCSACSVGHSIPVCLVGAAWLVQLGWCSSVGALETSAPPKSAP